MIRLFGSCSGGYGLAATMTARASPASSEPAQAPAPVAVPLPDMPGTEYLLQMLLSLLAVAIAIVVVAWVLRRVMRMQGSAAGNMRVLGGLSLGSRERVVVVEAGDTQLLLGVAPGRVVALHVFDKPVFTATKPKTGGFAKQLQSAFDREKSA